MLVLSLSELCSARVVGRVIGGCCPGVSRASTQITEVPAGRRVAGLAAGTRPRLILPRGQLGQANKPGEGQTKGACIETTTTLQRLVPRRGDAVVGGIGVGVECHPQPGTRAARLCRGDTTPLAAPSHDIIDHRRIWCLLDEAAARYARRAALTGFKPKLPKLQAASIPIP